jgi:cardiolipin synthase A/B
MATSHAQMERPGNADISVRGEALLPDRASEARALELLQMHLAAEQAATATGPLVPGNKLTLLQNGPATYEAMFAAMRAAEHHINLETYIFNDDEAGGQFAGLLLERQAAGVQVNIIYDSVGGLMTPAAFFDRLRDHGVRVLEFNPINPLAAMRRKWRMNNRDHRKQLIVDGRIAFVGGINISDTYSSAPMTRRGRRKRSRDADSGRNDGWRDTHVQIEGPVVAQFQRLFIDTWKRQQGAPLPERKYFPAIAASGDGIVRAIGSTPRDAESHIYETLIAAIHRAAIEVHLTIAYFGPDERLRAALTGAVQRGVDVRLILPSRTDVWPTLHLGRSHYTELLRGGVRIFERRGAIMHAKTICIDGVWSTIGSTNLNSRSFLHDDEINAVILNTSFGRQMRTMFAEDLSESDEILLERWQQRSWLQQLKERAAGLGEYWL